MDMVMVVEIERWVDELTGLLGPVRVMEGT
jgi:hypothetical protein